MRSLGGFIFSALVISFIAQAIAEYDERYAYYYAVIVLLGVAIFNASAVSSFINFALSQNHKKIGGGGASVH